jgi:uncharacterized 2Fe-2S/4Fe-4S cluster protein (DUF4445 family)
VVGLVQSTSAARVTFHPEGVAIDVERGATLLDAARSAGVLIASICGGDGICGRCRVQVRSGTVDADPTALLTREEIQQGYVLACQTRVVDHVEVTVPPEARGEGAQILVDEDADRFRALTPALGGSQEYPYAPIVSKLYVELPPPTLQDHLGCQERLYREIRRRVDAPRMQMGLKVLQSLPQQHRDGKWRITATLGSRGDTIEVIQIEEGDRTDASYGIVVDVGTSTVVVHLVDLISSKTLDAEACYNSQIPYGAEVTRRIIHAEREGAGLLRKAIVGDINRLINTLVTRTGVELHNVVACFASGNTTMLHFLLGLDTAHIRKSPYVPATTNPPPVRAAEVGIRINPRGILYSMPSIGSWVGGDITAGILATGLADADRLTMFIDVGTNGEIVLGNSEWMLACATSAGPAFEGSGVKCGMRASRGAIERAAFAADGSIELETIGNAKPLGICGSGLIDAIAGLFETGSVDRSGQLLPKRSDRIRERDGTLEFVLAPAADADADIVVTQADIENVLRAKAAIYAGAKILLESTEHAFTDIDRLLIAGGFGNYLDGRKAVLLGMIPDIPAERIHFVGNTSLNGAKMALLSSAAFERSTQIARSATYYDLITYPDYYEEFMSAKFLPHTDLGLFPTVADAVAASTTPENERTAR